MFVSDEWCISPAERSPLTQSATQTSHPTNQLQLLIVSDPWPLNLTLTPDPDHDPVKPSAFPPHPQFHSSRHSLSPLQHFCVTHTQTGVCASQTCHSGEECNPSMPCSGQHADPGGEWKVNEAYCALEYLYCPLFPLKMSSFTRLHQFMSSVKHRSTCLGDYLGNLIRRINNAYFVELK